MELNEYQRLAAESDQQPDPGVVASDPGSILVPLLGLAGETGELLSEHKKWLRDGESYRLFPDRVEEELGDILWYLTNIATKHGLVLGDIADQNLAKIRSRWQTSGGTQRPRMLFDDGFPEQERLPRKMDVSISQEVGKSVTMTINGALTGDPLRDNRYVDDGYRFHDVFHLAYASVLGWSPTVRSLMKRKRKSNPEVDEVEDGGRAIAIEEGIAAMVFSYAEQRNFLDGIEALDYQLIRTIKDMTAHLEVSCRSLREWENAVFVGFEIWRHIRKSGEGLLRADLERGTIALVG